MHLIPKAFRKRFAGSNEASGDLPLGQLLSFAEPRDRVSAAVRTAQLDALVKLVPVTVVSQLFAAALIALSLRGMVPAIELATWFGLILLLGTARGSRALRILRNPDYARRKPPRLATIVALIALLGVIWVMPAFLWFERTDTEHKFLLGVMVVGLMSAGSVTLASVPQAAMLYILILSTGGLWMTSRFDQPFHSLLLLVFAGALMAAAIANARRFVRHVRLQIELGEQSEMIRLLREFEASGSDWLWELDSRLRLTYVSKAMAEAIGRPLDELIGTPARQILDPHGAVLDLSAGVRKLMRSARDRAEFRDVAVPVRYGRAWWSLSGKPLIDASGKFLGWRGVGSDITDVRKTGSDAVSAARTDPLTGVANRMLVREQLEEALLRQLHGEGGCALLLVDLDRFKLVNDTLGHYVGDQLLCEVARRLVSCIGVDGSVGRLGGDEFTIVVPGPVDDPALESLARTIIAELSRPITIATASLHIGATIGIARAPRDGNREESLMRAADLALYRRKEEGRGGYAFFDQQMYLDAEDYRTLENDLREALAGGGLAIHYQPVVDSDTGALVGREALLRWHHPTRGDIPPDQFVPIIEDAGLIHQIGDWVIREACAQAVQWPSDARIAVNISAAQLSGAGLSETVLGALAATGLDPARLELEVTESIFIADDQCTLAALERLSAIGVRLVLDDFGKGYSSFGYLSRAKFAKIKIDRAFVRGAAQGERESIAIVGAILALARGLDVETTAEGVETEQEARCMRELGCDHLQGFLFGRPVPAENAVPDERRKRA